MLRTLGKTLSVVLRWALLTLNALCILALWACVACQFVPPQACPSLSLLGLVFPLCAAATALFIPLWLLVRRRWTWVPVAGLLACAASLRTFCPLNIPRTAPEGSIKVLTFNLYNLPHTSAEPLCEHPALRYISESGADIVCCQEAPGLATDARADSLLATVYPYRSYPASRTASFALLSKFPILSEEQIDYESQSNGSFAYRLLVGGDTLLLLNNHFESYRLGSDDREEYKELILHPQETDVELSLRSLAAKVKSANSVRGPQADSVAAYIERARETNIILCGDFNDPTISYTHHRLTRRLNDAYTRSGNGPGISYHLSGMYFRIDNILYSPGMKAYGAAVDRSIHASDHYPLSCSISLAP